MIPPYTLSDLKKYDHTYRLLRKKEVEERYEEHILFEKGIPEIIEAFKDPDTKYLFLPNNFPYDVEDGIEHYVFWVASPEYDKNFVIDFLSSMGMHDYAIFENLPQHKSIKNINHYHVFYKK